MDSEILIIEHIDDIAIIKLHQGITNPINLPLVQALSIKYQNVVHDEKVKGIVLTSHNDKFFSIGLDIPTLMELSEEDLMFFYRSFNQLCLDLFSAPIPIVAAIPGHAIAGAYILALCCDYRYIAEGRKLVGLNEIKLGLPVPYIADCILRNLIGYRSARDVIDSGDLYEPSTALGVGLVDDISPLDGVLETSIKKIKAISDSSLKAFSVIKSNRITPVIDEIRVNLREREEIFTQHWFSPEAQAHLREAMKKF